MREAASRPDNINRNDTRSDETSMLSKCITQQCDERRLLDLRRECEGDLIEREPLVVRERAGRDHRREQQPQDRSTLQLRSTSIASDPAVVV